VGIKDKLNTRALQLAQLTRSLALAVTPGLVNGDEKPSVLDILLPHKMMKNFVALFFLFTVSPRLGLQNLLELGLLACSL
jgi:hypothetical protein